MKWRKFANRLNVKIITVIICVILPLATLPIIFSWYSLSIINQNAIEDRLQILSLNVQKIEESLSGVQSMVKNMALSGNETKSLAFDLLDADRYTITEQLVYQHILSTAAVYPDVEIVFIYSRFNERLLLMTKFTDQYAIRNSILSYFKEKGENPDIGTAEWRSLKINDRYYFSYIQSYGNLYIGALRSAESCIRSISDGIGNEFYAMLDGNGEVMYTTHTNENSIKLNNEGDSWKTGNNYSYTAVKSELSSGDFTLVNLTKTRDIVRQLPDIFLIFIILFFAGILLIPVTIFLLKQVVIQPINVLLCHMNEVSSGNLNSRLKTKRVSNEFERVFLSFNEMMDRIQQLQRDILEEQAERRKIELMQLQYQIRPHFFLNALNLIFHLAQTGKFESIQAMVLSLADYFRYAFRIGIAPVPLKDEIKFVQSYLGIQKVHMGDKFSYAVEVDKRVEQKMIPPFCLASFVENAFKHGKIANESFFVSIEAKYLSEPDEICITITDNGCGFEETLLQQLNGNRLETPDTGYRMGLWNVHRQFKLFYGDLAFVKYANTEPHGAQIQIHIKTDEQIKTRYVDGISTDCPKVGLL